MGGAEEMEDAVDMDAEGVVPFVGLRSVILPGLRAARGGDDVVEAAEARAGRVDQRVGGGRLGGVAV